MSDVTTLDPIFWPLMYVGDYLPGWCAVCGRTSPLEKHHIVKRSAGELYENDKKLDKPLIHLCGFGNNLKDADGHYFCHGKAHANMLHFRESEGRLEVLELNEPTEYLDALDMEGWRKI